MYSKRGGEREGKVILFNCTVQQVQCLELHSLDSIDDTHVAILGNDECSMK